jgi:hypothetical protein
MSTENANHRGMGQMRNTIARTVAEHWPVDPDVPGQAEKMRQLTDALMTGVLAEISHLNGYSEKLVGLAAALSEELSAASIENGRLTTVLAQARDMGEPQDGHVILINRALGVPEPVTEEQPDGDWTPEPLADNEIYDDLMETCDEPYSLTDEDIVFVVRAHWADSYVAEMPEQGMECRLAKGHPERHAVRAAGTWLTWDESSHNFGAVGDCPYTAYGDRECGLPEGHDGPHPLWWG